MPLVPELTVGPWRLRPLRPSDAEAWFAIVRDPELRRLTSWSIDDVAAMRAVIAAHLEGPLLATRVRWAIVDDADGLCGTCGFKDIDAAAGAAEIVFELAAGHRGRGVMGAVAAVVLAYGFGDLGLRSVCALVNDDNVASRRLLERLGFARTASLPAFRACGGELRDFGRYELAAPVPR